MILPRRPEWEKGPSMRSRGTGGLGEEPAWTDASRLQRSSEEVRVHRHVVGKAGRVQELLSPGGHQEESELSPESCRKPGERFRHAQMGVWGQLLRLLSRRALEGQVLEAGSLVCLAGPQEVRTGSGCHHWEQRRRTRPRGRKNRTRTGWG